METLRYTKDPNAVLDYQWDWSGWLPAGDTISTSVVSVASGSVVINSQSHTTTTVTAWISGGSASTEAMLTARIVTAEGRTDDRTITLMIRER